MSAKPRGYFFWTAIWTPLPVWKRLDMAVLVVVVYSVVVGLVYELTSLDMPNWGGLLTVLNVIVLGILLQFRNRESYERWWEARKLWGQLVNDSRNFCVKIGAIQKLDPADKVEFGELVAGFAVALKNHLRETGKSPAETPTAIGGQIHQNAPLEYLRRTALKLRECKDAGKLSDWDLLLLDPHARGQSDVLGACERIKNTPLPLSYRSLLRHGLVLYLISSPWLVFDEIRWWGIPAIALLTYFLIGIEFTAEDVEEPFGRDADDLALNTYCETIRKSVNQVLSASIATPADSIDG